MVQVRIQRAASARLDDIYRYTRDRWGEAQADGYVTDLFKAFDMVRTGDILSRPIPAEFGVSGQYFRHEHHVVYWRVLGNGDIGIVTILHERMHQFPRLKDDFGRS